MTPLIKACFFGNTESSRILIENNANLYACDAVRIFPNFPFCSKTLTIFIAQLEREYTSSLELLTRKRRNSGAFIIEIW